MGDVVSLTVEILKDIRDEMRGVNVRLERVETQQVQTNTRLLQIEARQAETNARLDQTNARLEQTNSRLDNLIVLNGRGWRDLERRVRRLERQSGN